MKVKVLPAYNGDSLLISFQTDSGTKNILIDGGIGKTYHTLKKEFEKIRVLNETVDLLIITHIDNDHIAGIIKLFGSSKERDLIKKVWFNSGQLLHEYFHSTSITNRAIEIVEENEQNISVAQGITLESKLNDMGIWEKTVIHNKLEPIKFYDMNITILSPSLSALEVLNNNWQIESQKSENISSSNTDYNNSISELIESKLPSEDNTIPNGSSIAMLLDHNSIRCMVLSDAHPSTIYDSLSELGYSENNPIHVDLVKISHHGSSRNISENFIKSHLCSQYIISTNGSTHGLPNKLCLAKLIGSNKQNITFYFNYGIVEEKRIFSNEDKHQYNFKCVDLSSSEFNYEIDL